MKSLNSTGVALRYSPNVGWIATVEYSTWEHANQACVDGRIGTCYFESDLVLAIDRALDAAKAIGVRFPVELPGVEPHIYVEGDGEDEAVHLPPDWRQLVKAQCDRLGWRSCYAAEQNPE